MIDRILGPYLLSAARESPVIALTAEPVRRLVYGGDSRQRRTDVDVVPWGEVQDVDWDPLATDPS